MPLDSKYSKRTPALRRASTAPPIPGAELVRFRGARTEPKQLHALVECRRIRERAAVGGFGVERLRWIPVGGQIAGVEGLGAMGPLNEPM